MSSPLVVGSRTVQVLFLVCALDLGFSVPLSVTVTCCKGPLRWECNAREMLGRKRPDDSLLESVIVT